MEDRLPVTDMRRRDRRDAKLTFREELLADRHRQTKRLCPCNICMGENRSMRFRAVVRQHLHKYGRHPYRRGSTEVRNGVQTYFIAYMKLCIMSCLTSFVNGLYAWSAVQNYFMGAMVRITRYRRKPRRARCSLLITCKNYVLITLCNTRILLVAKSDK